MPVLCVASLSIQRFFSAVFPEEPCNIAHVHGAEALGRPSVGRLCGRLRVRQVYRWRAAIAVRSSSGACDEGRGRRLLMVSVGGWKKFCPLQRRCRIRALRSGRRADCEVRWCPLRKKRGIVGADTFAPPSRPPACARHRPQSMRRFSVVIDQSVVRRRWLLVPS